MLVGGGVLFLFLQKLAETAIGLTRFSRPEDWIIPPDALFALVAVGAILLVVRRSQRGNGFLNEVASELTKVTWPGRKETVLSTGVVAAMVGASALVLFLFDFLWGMVSRGILGY